MSTTHTAGQHVSRNIKNAMEARGLSRKAVYDAANITRHTFDRRMASGAGWTLDEVEAIARFVGVDTWALLPERVERNAGQVAA